MVICETTVRPMAALWRPCHRGICESFHIRWGGRASTDGLAASRRANTMASMCEWISANAKLLTTKIIGPQTLVFKTYLSKSELRSVSNLTH
jgi:hypothetical protein